MVIHKGVCENDVIGGALRVKTNGSRQGKARRLPGSQSKVTETDNSGPIRGPR